MVVKKVDGSGTQDTQDIAEDVTIQVIKEIVGNHSDADIFATRQETDNDPDETTPKLLYQDPFHEVRRKSDKKEELTVECDHDETSSLEEGICSPTPISSENISPESKEDPRNVIKVPIVSTAVDTCVLGESTKELVFEPQGTQLTERNAREHADWRFLHEVTEKVLETIRFEEAKLGAAIMKKDSELERICHNLKGVVFEGKVKGSMLRFLIDPGVVINILQEGVQKRINLPMSLERSEVRMGNGQGTLREVTTDLKLNTFTLRVHGSDGRLLVMRGIKEKPRRPELAPLPGDDQREEFSMTFTKVQGGRIMSASGFIQELTGVTNNYGSATEDGYDIHATIRTNRQMADYMECLEALTLHPRLNLPS